jgi:DNA-binding IscR family transcriptional regulator
MYSCYPGSMRIRAIEEYGLRCLLQVAFPPGPAPLTGPEIARREGLGPEYVARTMRALWAGRPGDEHARGCGRLPPRPAGRISVWEAVRALWRKLEGMSCGALERISLEDLRCDEPSMATWLDSVSPPADGPQQRTVGRHRLRTGRRR